MYEYVGVSVRTHARTYTHTLACTHVCMYDVRKYSFSQRTINVWNNLSTDGVHASSANMFKNKIDKYLVKARRWSAIYFCHFLT